MTNDRLGSDELAAREPARVPTTAAEAADLQDKYDRMLRLADLFDRSGDELRYPGRPGRARSSTTTR